MRRSFITMATLLATTFCALLVQQSPAAEPARLKVLFLGDSGHHVPRQRFAQLQPVLAKRGIDLVYTDFVGDLNPQTLQGYDALAIYANTVEIAPEQEQALLDYVASGKGFVPLHCASYCFLNSPKYIALVGAQFQRHETGVFRTTLLQAEHPIMKGFKGFESWDETYVHTKHNETDRTVLETRTEGDREEPWTWVRQHGKGRVFYTAWGHDARTWSHPGFQNLVERGIRWAAGQDLATVPGYVERPEMTAKRTDVKPFEYVEANIPFYPPSRQWGKIGDPIKKMQKPVDPEESLKHMVRPVGFEPVLFAAEPQIGKPLCMAWDERGRLWIAETVDYPNELQPPGAGRDRIRICEDTDGDGRADKFTVFADKLSIPTSITFSRGGAIVHQAPDTLFLRDTDGDDVCDERKVLFTGWGTEDTHAGPSNLHWGLDNWIYGMVGYSGFRGTVGGEQINFSSGFYRFRPDGSKLEFLRSTNNNSWGVGFSEEGILFGSTANGNPSEYLPVPNRYYESVRGWSSTVLGGIAESNKFEPITENVRQVDWHGGFTAASGHALYTARAYPPEYWNRTAFVTEPTGHLIATFVLRPNGAGFTSKNSWNLLASDDEWTSPIAAEVGPDGNVWFIDWYNFIVQHNPTPVGFKTGRRGAYETDARDKVHGRIYRLVWKAMPKPDDKPEQATHRKIRTLQKESADALVQVLANDNMFWRQHAQRLLIERGKTDIVPSLIKLVNKPEVDPVGLNVGAIHALWTLHGLGALTGGDTPEMTAALKAATHKSAGVRRAAVQVLPLNHQASRAAVEARLDPQEDPQVRLAALLALADAPPAAGSAPRILDVLVQNTAANDRWIADAATSAAARNALPLMIEAARRKQPQLNDPLLLDRLAIVAEHYGRTGVSDQLPTLLAALADAPHPLMETIVAGLERGWPKDKPANLGDAGDAALVKLFEHSTPAIGSRLAALGTRWGSKKQEAYAAKIAEGLLAIINDPNKKEPERIAAARQLIDFRRADATSAQQLVELISAKTSPELGRGLLEAIGRSEASETATFLIERMRTFPPTLRSTVLRILLSRNDWTKALVDAAGEGQLSLADLALDQKQSLMAHPDKQLAAKAKELLAKGGGLPDPDRQKVIEQLASITHDTGDAAAGKELFKKHCSKCHVHSGEGTRIGPDLTGMAVHPKEELLIHILDPNRSVEGNFRVYSVVTTDGRISTGLLASESKTAIELFDAEGKKQSIQREDIEELIASTKSLMPEGFEKQVTKAELTNLLEFLTQRGKFLPLDLRKVATIVSTKSMFVSEDADVERLIFPDWSPKMVDGVPFLLVDPQGDRVPNCILLHSTNGTFPNKMPKSVTLPCNAPAKTIHLLGGVAGWGSPYGEKGSTSLIVRLKYADGEQEDHPLKNGEQIADYIRRVDVPGSKFAFALRGQQIRYVAVHPQRKELIKEIEFVKGPDTTAPVVMAVTVEGP
jgi:uncharacterized protein